MLFITTPHLRKLEAFMQEVPNFPSKGSKIDFDSLEDEILLFEIENVIINVKPPNENLNIRKENIMKFRNEKHRSTFLNEAKKQSLKNYKIVAALYLLTADEKLWDTAKSSVGKDDILLCKMRSPISPNFITKPIGGCLKLLQITFWSLRKIFIAPTIIGRTSHLFGCRTENMRYILGLWTVGVLRECCL